MPILLPATSVCTVVEDTLSDAALVDSSYAWNAPDLRSATGTVTLAATGDNEVTVTNSTDRVYGSFRITKVIDLAGSAAARSAVHRHLELHPRRGPRRRRDLAGRRRRHRPVLGDPGRIAVPDHRGEPPQSPSPDPSYAWAGHDRPRDRHGRRRQPARLTVTNPTHGCSPLRITKVLVGDTAGEPAGKPYDMSYACIDGSGAPPTDSHSIDAGETWTTDRVIPLGSTCTVTEGDLPDVSPKYAWLPVAFTVTGPVEPGATVAQETGFTLFNPQEEGNPLAHVVVTNTLKQQLPGEGPVWTLEKSSDPPSGSTVAPDTSITYTLTVTNRSTTTSLPAGTVITDDLSDVLNHASFVGIRDGHVGVAVLRGTKLVDPSRGVAEHGAQAPLRRAH